MNKKGDWLEVSLAFALVLIFLGLLMIPFFMFRETYLDYKKTQKMELYCKSKDLTFEHGVLYDGSCIEIKDKKLIVHYLKILHGKVYEVEG